MIYQKKYLYKDFSTFSINLFNPLFSKPILLLSIILLLLFVIGLFLIFLFLNVFNSCLHSLNICPHSFHIFIGIKFLYSYKLDEKFLKYFVFYFLNCITYFFAAIYFLFCNFVKRSELSK